MYKLVAGVAPAGGAASFLQGRQLWWSWVWPGMLRAAPLTIGLCNELFQSIWSQQPLMASSCRVFCHSGIHP